MRDEIETTVGTRVILENDANAAALGETWIGAGKDVDDLVLLTLGTGIGGGIIHKGRVVRGMVGMAGEVGHMTVVPNGNPCGCGNIGCLEKHASATAVEGMAAMMGLGDSLTSRDVFEHGRASATRMRQRVFERMGVALGDGAGHADQHVQLPAVPAERRRAAGLETISPRRCSRRWSAASFTLPAHRRPASSKAALGNEAGLYGAAYLPIQTHHSNT